MTQTAAPAWHTKRTAETNMVEEALRNEGFERADAYRYNSASIRVRVIDSRFEGMPRDQRDALVEAVLDKLPEETQQDIVTLFTFAPSELQVAPKTLREYMLNSEFEDPNPLTGDIVTITRHIDGSLTLTFPNGEARISKTPRDAKQSPLRDWTLEINGKVHDTYDTEEEAINAAREIADLESTSKKSRAGKPKKSGSKKRRSGQAKKK